MPRSRVDVAALVSQTGLAIILQQQRPVDVGKVGQTTHNKCRLHSQRRTAHAAGHDLETPVAGRLNKL